MIEAFILISLIVVSAASTGLIVDRMDRLKTIQVLEAEREKLREALEKISNLHNETVRGMADINGKLTSMDLRITAVAAAVGSHTPQQFRGVRS